MRTNYVLIDLENVQPKSLSGLASDHLRTLVFVGAGQAKLPFELACEMQKLGTKAEYVKISGNGSNALDFHIAYYIGKLAAEDSSAYFHIISRDTGFDPLIQHLKTRKLGISRSKTIEDIPLLKAANSKTLSEKVTVVLSNLRQRGASKPRTLKTLSSTIVSLFQKQLPETELADLLAELQTRGIISVHENRVSYVLPEAD